MSKGNYLIVLLGLLASILLSTSIAFGQTDSPGIVAFDVCDSSEDAAPDDNDVPVVDECACTLHRILSCRYVAVESIAYTPAVFASLKEQPPEA